jgi:hypothetical protein
MPKHEAVPFCKDAQHSYTHLGMSKQLFSKVLTGDAPKEGICNHMC